MSMKGKTVMELTKDGNICALDRMEKGEQDDTSRKQMHQQGILRCGKDDETKFHHEKAKKGRLDCLNLNLKLQDLMSLIWFMREGCSKLVRLTSFYHKTKF
jgi:hypothetical protein